MDLSYLLFQIEEWYIDHIRWRIEHHILGRRCENCRNWTFVGSPGGQFWGECALHTHYWYGYHGWCPVWNIDFNADERGYTRDEDGCMRVWHTPAGKKIIQESKNGIWMYKKDFVEGEEP